MVTKAVTSKVTWDVKFTEDEVPAPVGFDWYRVELAETVIFEVELADVEQYAVALAG